MDYGTTIYQGDGNCRGWGSVQLGQMAAAETGWKIVFNAQDTANSVAYGVGLATAGGGLTPSVVWLTATDGNYERDPVMARIGSGTPARYLVGWMTTNDGAFHLGVIDGSGTFLEGPEQLSPTGPRWGNRDDSFRPAPGGAVVWVEGASGSTNLALYLYIDAAIFSDGFESGLEFNDAVGPSGCRRFERSRREERDIHAIPLASPGSLTDRVLAEAAIPHRLTNLWRRPAFVLNESLAKGTTAR